MTSPFPGALDVDKDFDDAALWAVIDSVASASGEPRRLLPIKQKQLAYPIPESAKNPRIQRSSHCSDEKVGLAHENQSRPHLALAMVKHPHVMPTAETKTANDDGKDDDEQKKTMRHSLSGRFPTVSLFKEYQNAAMAILEKGDYTVISGNPYIKKTGWRKIAFYFNLSFEIREKKIEMDEKRNVERAEFMVRGYMGDRFCDGWGSCDKREKKFMKPNHDIPSTAETRAKNKASQDLLGIGEYRPKYHNSTLS